MLVLRSVAVVASKTRALSSYPLPNRFEHDLGTSFSRVTRVEVSGALATAPIGDYVRVHLLELYPAFDGTGFETWNDAQVEAAAALGPPLGVYRIPVGDVSFADIREHAVYVPSAEIEMPQILHLAFTNRDGTLVDFQGAEHSLLLRISRNVDAQDPTELGAA